MPAHHVPVLLDAVLRVLAPRAGETYVDCTAGLGGHAAEVAKVVGGEGTVVLNDMDRSSLDRAEGRLRGVLEGVKAGARARIVTLHGNFADLPRKMGEIGLQADMVLADLGFASPQVEEPGRGFSFARDGPLDMRMDQTSPMTAADLVASLPEGELADLIWEFGEERNSRRIARKLVEARRDAPITTTGRLADLVRAASGMGGSGAGSIDPATRTFQALRIAVNDEIGSLHALLESVARGAVGARSANSSGWLRSGARVGIISFHSLEDRPVKRVFAEMVKDGSAEHLTRKPLTADEAEVGANARSRSAKLRAIRVV